MLSAEEIKDLVNGGEGYNVDFKRSVPSKVRELGGPLLQQYNKAILQSKVIQTVKTNPSLTMEQIGKTIGIGRTSVYKIVKSLKEIGILEHKGRKSDGEWVVKSNSVTTPKQLV